MEYHLNELDPVSFQRLVNAVLVSRLGEDARVTPLLGQDGGRDTETAEGNPYIQFEVKRTSGRTQADYQPRRPGRYIFQSKFHRTTDYRIADVRNRVLSDFTSEIQRNILPLHHKRAITYFFLITNVPSSKDILQKLDNIRRNLLSGISDLHVDIWWKDQLAACLDLLPQLWTAFPSIFAGGRVPMLSELVSSSNRTIPRAVRIALRAQYKKDKVVKFRQIDLAKELSRLFVDLDIDFDLFNREIRLSRSAPPADWSLDQLAPGPHLGYQRPRALSLLLDESMSFTQKVLLEGGPGQGKSTLTQMAAQIYRQNLLGETDLPAEDRWRDPTRIRLPIRIELRHYADQLSRDPAISLEKYFADIFAADAGGTPIDVATIHDIVQNSPVILFLDGLDEVGSDELRDLVLEKIGEAVVRFEQDLDASLKVVLTSRPPAIAGRQGKLLDYSRLTLSALSPERVNEYLRRWVNVQLVDENERSRVRDSFESRRSDPHVEALIKNPMQLSVLLHFIYLKDDAFPSRRADLYQEYFKIVIDRDVEKSAALRREREIVEGLHRFLGFRIHALAEAQLSDGSLGRTELLTQVGNWLESRGDNREKASQLFKLGEERLGLIATLKGEGTSARYGFEVQPIREYFAADHINQDLEINAHDLFEAMVRRPFWREVALFLAGLRRENERADLVSRARKLDQDDALGWKHDGKDIILQLVKEGALSQPRHVLSESLDFAMDLLDPALVAVPYVPKDSAPTIARVLSLNGLETHRNRIRLLLDRYSHCDDITIVSRLMRAASGILSIAEFAERLLSLECITPNLTAHIRLRIPYESELSPPVSDRRFWEGVPESVWARELWLTAMTYPEATNLNIPSTLHAFLLERFAFGELGRLDHAPAVFSGRMVAWRLVDYEKLISQLVVSHVRRSIRQKRASAMVRPAEMTLDYSGLEGGTQSVCRRLIAEAQEFVSVLEDKSGEAVRVGMQRYMETLGDMVEEPGIDGLLAARLLAPLQFYHDERGTLLMRHLDGPKSPISRAEQLIRIGGSGELFYAQSQHRRSRSVGLRAIRLRSGARPTTIRDLIREFLQGEPAPEWILRLPIGSDEIRPILDKCQAIEPDTLARLSCLDIRTAPIQKPLKTSQLQRILGIARRTEDGRVLAGCILAIIGSRFMRLGGKDLLLKFLSNRRGSVLAGFLFRGQQREQFESANLYLTKALVEEIMREPSKFEMVTRIAAAAYYSENIKSNFPPLVSGDGSIVMGF